jgi:hypothetical protein
MKETIGILTVLLSIIGHTPYIIDTYKKKTRPHVFSWLIVSIVTTIAFVAQLASGAGAGSWSTGITAIIVIIVAVLAVRNKNTEISFSDKVFFVLALLAIIPWYLTKNPTLSVIMVTILDACAFIPTLRKTLKDPESETFATYSINIIRHLLSLVAISTYNLTTILYPAYLLVLNVTITTVILNYRFKQKKNNDS